jgi:chorismate--pyruvate lyase
MPSPGGWNLASAQSQESDPAADPTTLLTSPTVLWQAPLNDVLAATAGRQLTGAWKLMLLGDGGPTRHLQLLSGHPVSVEVIAMAPHPLSEPGDPEQVRELEPPLLRRQVWLVCAGETLAWAESWWNSHQAEIHLRDRRQPIWTSLTAGRAELFREVDGLGQVEAEWLTQRFGLAGPYWSRHYRFFRAGRELTVIREVFSPALQRWLGDPVVCASTSLSND